MKIFFVIESLSSKGGAENALINLVLELKKIGFELEIIYLWGQNDFIDILLEAGIKTYDLNLKSRWDILQGFVRLLRIINKGNPDILNAVNFFPMFYVSITKIFSKNIKRIVSYHNMGYETYPANNIVKKTRKTLDILLNKTMDGHTAVSKAVAASYKKHLKLSQIKVINNIIPVETISMLLQPLVPKEKMKRESQSYEIIMAGRLVPEKGYEYMIQAMELLIKKGLNINLNIFGEGLLKSSIIEKIVSFNLGKHIQIHNTVDYKILFKSISNSDILVLSSVSEGFPMAAAEAMAIGTPVIATSVGGLPEMIEDNVSGVLVPPRDPNALSHAIEKVLLDKDLHLKLSAGGKVRIHKKFSPTTVCAELIDYFKEVRAIR